MVLPIVVVLIGLVAVTVALLRDPSLTAAVLPPPDAADDATAAAPPDAADDATAAAPPDAADDVTAVAPRGPAAPAPVVHRSDPQREALRTEAALQALEERRR